MKRLERKNCLWYIYPISGLQIEHQENIDDFLFKDATVVSYEDLLQYYKNTKFTLDEKHREDYLMYLRKHKNRTLLIVEIYKEFTHEDSKEIQSRALIRAKQIISLIYFCYLYMTDLKYGISFCSEVYSLNALETNHISASGSFSDSQATNEKGMLSQVPDPEFIVTYQDLNLVFKKRIFLPLYNLVNEKLCELTLNALVFFYDTSHTPSNISQTLGANVAIEILFKNNGNYDDCEKVLKLILGRQYKQFQTEKKKNQQKQSNKKSKKNLNIFNLRHNIVHEGRMPTQEDVNRTIGLFSKVLVLYGYYFDIYKSNSKLNSYLKIFAELRYNDTLKKDVHSMLPLWNHIKFDVTDLNQDIYHMMQYYRAVSSDKSIDVSLPLTNCIYSLAEYRCITLLESYDLIVKAYYKADFPFSSIAEVVKIYKSKKVECDKTVATYLEFYKGWF